MLNPSINKLLDKVDSRYTLVMLVSKRARQIVEGDKPKTNVISTKPVTLALFEVSEDKISYTRPELKDLK